MKVPILRPFTRAVVIGHLGIVWLFLYGAYIFVNMLSKEFHVVGVLFAIFFAVLAVVVFYIYIYQLRRETFGYLLIEESSVSAIFLGRKWFNAEWRELTHFGALTHGKYAYVYFSTNDISAKTWLTTRDIWNEKENLVVFKSEKLTLALQEYSIKEMQYYGQL